VRWGAGALGGNPSTSRGDRIRSYLPVAATAALAWTVGEESCRERWAAKLASFDALLRGRLGSATVARAAIRGPAAGLTLAAALLLLLGPLRRLGAEALSLSFLGPLHETSLLPGASTLLFFLLYGSFVIVYTLLFLFPVVARRLGLTASSWPTPTFQRPR